jgi:hypothetical protein
VSESIADKFIRVMAELRGIDPDTDEPMRYAMRQAKQVAEHLIYNALQQAMDLAYCAKGMSKDCRDAIEEVRATTQTESDKP